MKIKLDENIPASIQNLFPKKQYDIDTVMDENLTGKSDELVWKACLKEKRLLITQDLDFSNINKFKPGKHAGIILVRLKNPAQRTIKSKLIEILKSGIVDRWKGCFVVISDAKIRVRYPVKDKA